MNDSEKNPVTIIKPLTIRVVDESEPLKLSCGKFIAPVDVAYETLGELNGRQDNAILICHALSGDAHVAGKHHPDSKKSGWWDSMVGPGKAIDTDKYFVICSNILGGCSGTTGPLSISPKTNSPYGLDFPIITIADMVKVQKLLLDKIGVKKLLSVIGGSLGGMQVLQWAIEYPDLLKSAIAIATTTNLNPQSIAFDAVGRNAILADPNFNMGQYHNGPNPDMGLGIARMIGHITYLSEEGMREKFGRQLRDSEKYNYDFKSEFSVETYLDYQGRSFVERFDANSYLYITKAMDYFDLEKDYGSLTKAFEKSSCRFLIASFTSDWLFTPAQGKRIAKSLTASGKDVSFCNIDSPYGHDAFLLETETLGNFIAEFLKATHKPKAPVYSRINTSKQIMSKFQQAQRTRVDYEIISSLIEPGSTVLDTGCGDGELLSRLIADKNIKAEGIECQQGLVLECIKRRLPIIQHDIEQLLPNHGDKSFDYVILSQTVQALHNPKKVFGELLRLGKKVIVSFPNFASWSCRWQLFFLGKAPVTKGLPFTWYNSPNVHFLSLKDFENFCKKMNVTIEKKIPLVKSSVSPVKILPNLFAEQAIYVTSKD